MVHHTHTKLKVGRSASKAIETVFKLVFGHHKDTYYSLTDEQKLLFDNQYPYLKQRADLVDRISKFGQMTYAIFAVTYLGIEFSSLFSLIATGVLFGYISLGLFALGFICYLTASIFREFFVDIPRNRLINDRRLKSAFDSIIEVRRSATDLRAYLSEVRKSFKTIDKFSRIDDIARPRGPDGDAAEIITLACLDYIDTVSRVIHPDAINVVVQGILDQRDKIPLDSAIVDNEQAQMIFLSDLSDFVESEHIAGGSKSQDTLLTTKKSSKSVKNKLSTDIQSEYRLRDPKFVEGWAMIKGELPDVSRLDSKGDYLELLRQINAIKASSVLLAELADSIRYREAETDKSFGQEDLRRIAKEIRQAVRAAQLDSTIASDVTLPATPSKRLITPSIDVPAIVLSVLDPEKQDVGFTLPSWFQKKNK